MVSLDYISDDGGLWGYGSTTFLATCTQFGQELRRNRRVGRTHVMFLLATIYGRRSKVYLLESSRPNLVGVLRQVSVQMLPPLRPSDEPTELAKFVILDLPIAHLVPKADGELYASPSWSITLRPPNVVGRDIQPHGTGRKWSIHSSMAGVFPGSSPGVVMAARCDGRLGKLAELIR